MADVINKISTELEVKTTSTSSSISALEKRIASLSSALAKLDAIMTPALGKISAANEILSQSKSYAASAKTSYTQAAKAADKYTSSTNKANKAAQTSYKNAPNSSAWKAQMKDYNKWTTYGASTSLKQAPADSGWKQYMNSMNKKATLGGQVAQGSFMGAFGAGIAMAATRVAMRAVRAFTNAVKQGVSDMNDYIEQTNLFFVSLTETYAGDAVAYIDKLSSSLGINDGILKELQGRLFMIGSSFGIAGDKAYELSEQVTKLTVDFASFYNQDYEHVQDNIIAGLVGQSRAMRKYGITVNEAAIAETALARGYEGSVRNLSEASKVQLRYITMMEQSTRQMNDTERTIETPANMMRIWNSQVEVLSRTLGSIFLPVLQSIMPVVMAITDALTKLFGVIAKIFGFKMPEPEFSGMNYDMEGLEEDSEDFADNLDGAANSAARIKKYFSGLDELNVMTDSSKGGVSGGGSIGNDIDFDFDDVGYDNMIQDVDAKWQWLSKRIEESWFVKDFMPALARVWAAVGNLLTTIVMPAITGFFKGIEAWKPVIDIMVKGMEAATDVINWFAKKMEWAAPIIELAGFVIGGAFVWMMLCLNPLLGVFTLIGAVVSIFDKVTGGFGSAAKEVDIFKGVTEETAEKLGVFQTYTDDARLALIKFEQTGMMSGEAHETLRQNIDGMISELRRLTEEEITESMKRLELEYSMGALTTEQYNARKAELTKFYADKLDKVEYAEKELARIYETYIDDQGKMTSEGYDELRKLHAAMDKHVKEEFVKSAADQKKLLENKILKEKNMQATAFSEILKEARAHHSTMLDDAETYKKGALEELDKMNKQTTEKERIEYKARQEQINKIYGEMVADADAYYDDIYNLGVASNSDLANQVDKNSGEILTGWDKFTRSFSNLFKGSTNDMESEMDSVSTSANNMSKDAKKSFEDMSKNLKTASGNVDTYTSSIIKKFNSASSAVKGFGTGLGTLGGTVNVQVKSGNGTVSMFANGGFPTTGSLFMAGEAGAELIGSHKGKTTVMPLENTGFVTAMYDAVKGAVISGMSMVEGQGGDVYVTMDGTIVGKASMKQSNAYSRRTGGR